MSFTKMASVFVATWDDGVFNVTGAAVRHELAGREVRCVSSDGRGNALAIIDGTALCRRSAGGVWSTIADGIDLACCVAVGTAVYAGTTDAHVVRMRDGGRFEHLVAFDRVSGRETWYAGTALVDGRIVGPPLGVRSIAATCDERALLVNVHVGGIPRSDDGGATWHPTIAIESDVHQVCAHPSRPAIVAAAAAVGLCLSRDGGATWTIERDGLHATHCTSVAFAGADVLVGSSTDPFAEEGAVYRRPVDGAGPLKPLDGGFPRWTGGTVDTCGIAVLGATVAVADRSGNLYVSADAGSTWARRADGLPAASGVLIIE